MSVSVEESEPTELSRRHVLSLRDVACGESEALKIKRLLTKIEPKPESDPES